MNMRTKIFYLLASGVLLAAPMLARAAEIQYTLLRPIEPLPTVISNDTSLTSYIQGAFYLFMGLSAIVAVIMGVIWGFTYMTSNKIDSKQEARNYLTQIMW